MLLLRCFTLLVVLNISWVVGMSLHDILDFSTYLEKTSLVQRPRIDGVVLEGDEDGAAGQSDEDDAPHPDAWEQSGKFEGDIILNTRQRRLIVEDVAEGLSRNGLKDITKRWPNNEVVYYIQKEHFSDGHVQAIMDGLDDIARSSCITFRPYKKGDPDAVVIQGSRRGCFSAVGYQTGYQVLNLSGRHPLGRGCFRHGTVVHEVLHSLGFYHMQSSPDRDDYIDVMWDNIIEGAKHNFRKYNTFSVTDFGVPYDYDSVLHYSKRAFSNNGKPTLVPKKGGADIGQRRGMSDSDVQKLNKMYCDKDSGSSSFDDSKDVPKKVVIKKKTNNNKPFEGHGLGYYKGKSIIVKLPQLETLELNKETIEQMTGNNKDAIQEDSEMRKHKSILGKDNNADDVFIDISKYIDNTGYPSKISFQDDETFDTISEPAEKSSGRKNEYINKILDKDEFSGDSSKETINSDYIDVKYSNNKIIPLDEYSTVQNSVLSKKMQSNNHTERTPQHRYDDYFRYTPKDSQTYSSEEIGKDPVGSRYSGYTEGVNYRQEQTKPILYMFKGLKSPDKYKYDEYGQIKDSTDPIKQMGEDDSKKHVVDSAEIYNNFDLYSIPAEVKDWWG